MALFMRLLFKSFSDGSTLKNEKCLLFLLAMFVTFTVFMSVTKLNFECYQLTFSKEAKNPNISSISARLSFQEKSNGLSLTFPCRVAQKPTSQITPCHYSRFYKN